MTAIVFDLDGTLNDPAEGLLAAINHALVKSGVAAREVSTLHRFIGPRLDEIFSELLQTRDRDRLQAAIDAYRDVYYSEGYKQSYVYAGIPESLALLAGNGFRLFVATAKRQDVADSVIDHFRLGPFFDRVYGCGLTRKKHEVLQEIRDLHPDRHLIMIGDRAQDIHAAKVVGAESIGVLWGYGDETELLAAGADAIAATPGELCPLLEASHARHNGASRPINGSA
jgi:phosphoglycolate phosphatase